MGNQGYKKNLLFSFLKLNEVFCHKEENFHFFFEKKNNKYNMQEK